MYSYSSEVSNRNIIEYNENGTKGTNAAASSRGKTQNDRIKTILPLTPFGMAKRLQDQSADRLLYCTDSGRWMIFDSGKYCQSKEKVEREVKQTIENFRKEIPSFKDLTIVKDTYGGEISFEDMVRFFNRLQSPKWINLILQTARLEEEFNAEESDFDQDEHLLNCRNVVVDLRSGKCMKHDPKLKMSLMAEAEFDPEAKSAEWEKFLDDITMEDKELQEYLQVVSGYALTGSNAEQVFFIFYGPSGSNGKSTFLNLMHKVAGSYARKTPMHTLLKKAENGINNDLARLKGIRISSAVEANQNRQLDEAKIKQLTGGDTVAARYLFHEYFEYTPKFKLFLSVNDLPRVASDDDAMFRRIRVIPFEAQFKGKNLNKDLFNRLSEPENIRAILAWMVKGAQKWYAHGLPASERVEAATRGYQKDADVLGQFIKETCICRDDRKVVLAEFYDAFQRWSKKNAFGDFGKREIRNLMIQKGYSQVKIGSARYWKGLKPDKLCIY